MHLRKITLCGFKSFADRIQLTFDRGITGIVGPNGSGKSNVIDAVRWVMGEQNTKNLRGQVATDIIFAGSERRKPLGMSEVSLHFDNTDSDPICPPEYRHEPEIVLTRRLYIDGEREYLINRKDCRLKDILDFFALTGLGGRSYSLIQQGQVDRILNARPEDVREILEEAAGTLIYKMRKADAERKLQGTELNLSRVQDILDEVTRQIEALKTQVEKAREWRDLSDELRAVEVTFLASVFRVAQDEASRLTVEIEQETAQEAEYLASLATLEARQASLQAEVASKNPELQRLQERVTSLRERVARTESMLANATQVMTRGESRLADLDRETGADTENLRQLEAQVAAAEAELNRGNVEVEELRGQLESLESDLAQREGVFSEQEQQIEELQEEIASLQRLSDQEQNRMDTTKRDISRLEAERAALLERRERLGKDLSEVVAGQEALQKALSTLREGLDREVLRRQERELILSQRMTQEKALQSERESLRERYLSTKARLESLHDLTHTATDMASAHHKLQTEAPETTAYIGGMLTDFVALRPQSELSERAVSAFERWCEKLIVRQWEHLADLASWCHRLHLGRVSVWVPTVSAGCDEGSVQEWASSVGAEPLAKYVDILRSDDLVARFLAGVFYMADPMLGGDVPSEIPAGVTLLTAHGLIGVGSGEFLVTAEGGRGLLQIRSEMAALSEEIKVQEAKLGQVQAQLDQLVAYQHEDRQVIGEIDRRLDQENQEVLKISGEFQAVSQRCMHTKALAEGVDQDLEKITLTLNSLQSDLARTQKTVAGYEEELEQQRSEVEGLQASISEIEVIVDEIRAAQQRKAIEHGRAEARLTSVRDQVAFVRDQHARLDRALLRRFDERHRIGQEIADAREQDKVLRTELESLVLAREEADQVLISLRQDHGVIIDELRNLEKSLREVRDGQVKAQRMNSQRALELERARMSLQSALETAQEKYHLDLHGYSDPIPEDFEPKRAEKTVHRLRAKIEALGPINMMALQEFETLVERQRFITAQRQEVVASMELLREAISEIESTSQTKFAATFEAVNRELGDLFPILFPGGAASLQLTHPDNLSASGVEIMVQLHGKKTQRMNLYSGGEKSLTAIALIFALLKTKPTPFCFLDEVDAALDEANVGRFNRVLQALSERFQFIVITHNRRTMEVLDTLYGVTMQEPGVSKIVGVDMKKDLPPHLLKTNMEVGTSPGPGPVPATPGRAVEGASAT